MQPIEVKRIEGKGIELHYADGSRKTINLETLRKECPCAECREKRGDNSHAKPLIGKRKSLQVIEHTRDEAMNLQKIWPIGNYALGMSWGDSHDSGIYTYHYLASLAK